jgi:hypothetical protein
VYVTEQSAGGRVRSLALGAVAAVAWVFFALLELAVKVALFFKGQRTQGATAVLWGLGFGVFLWAGGRGVGLEQARAIVLGLVGGAAAALFIYLRGAALENPPEAQPGAFHRRLRAGGRSTRQASRAPEAANARDLHRARVELTDGDLDGALFFLRQAERVAVAQRKLDELLEVRGLLSSLPRTDAVERLAWRIGEDLRSFPADELAAAGIHVQTEGELVESVRRLQTGDHTAAKNSELSLARKALDAGDLKQALFLLQDARRVAVAQRRPEELVEVYELVQSLTGRSTGQTRAAADELERKVVAGLRTFLPAAYS